MISLRLTHRAFALGVSLGMLGALAWACSGSVGPATTSPPPDAGPPSNHALKFNGRTDYAQAGTANFVSSSSPQTVSLWVWVSADDAGSLEGGAGNEQDFISLQKDIRSGLRLGINDDGLAAWPEATPTAQPLVESKMLLAAGWHHVAYVLDRPDAGFINTLYVDGVPTASTPATPDNFTPMVVFLGTSEKGGAPQYANYFAGELDEIRIWTVARTAAEVQEEMNGEVDAAEPGLVAYFNCDEVLDGGLLLDNSGNGNNAVLGGGDPNFTPALVASDR